MRPFFTRRFKPSDACLIGLLFLFGLGGTISRAAGLQAVHEHVPAAAKSLAPLGRLPGSQRLNLAVSLPLRNQAALDEYLRELSDPTNPNFRRYLTPAQFTQRFGPTQQDYDAVVNFASTHGLNVTAKHPNRMIVDVEGAVPTIEKALHVRMLSYQHPTEARKFYAPDVEPSVDLAVPIQGISGLNNYSLPKPNFKMRPAGLSAKAKPQSGSGPSQTYAGNDFRSAYVPNTSLTGTGQSVALVEYDGYYTTDITSYEGEFSVPNIPLVNVAVDGGVSQPGGNTAEVSLDIELAISMAPGLSNVYVYEAPNEGGIWDDLLNRVADDNLAKQISCSWSGGSPDATAEAIFKQMAAQGQSFFVAVGDSDAFTGSIPFPCDSPTITTVGGTTLTTTGALGSYVSETAWNWGDDNGNYVGTSGGVSTYYTIPTYQQGVSMASNQGSTTMRNVPDVALTADNIWVTYGNGASGEFGGTSCAAPLWAGFTALVNQQAVATTGTTVGFLNPAVYAIGAGANYNSDFHDITSGNNFWPSSPTKFAAVTGYDLCTGWGSPMGSAMISALAASPTPIIFNTGPLPSGQVGSNYSYPLTANGGRPSYTWSVVSGSLPAGLNLATNGLISGAPTTPGTANFVVQVTDSFGFSSSTPYALTIYSATTPVIAITSPLPNGTTNVAYNQTLTASGGTQPYAWSIASGALPAGLSLVGQGATAQITGTPTSAGPALFVLQVLGNNGLSSTTFFIITINQGPMPPTIVTTSLPNATVGIAYSQTLTASGGTMPYTWGLASGSLPAGLNLSSGGVISGTPTAQGTSNFTVKVTGGNALSSTGSFSITTNLPQPPTIVNTSLPSSILNVAYSQTLTATGGTTPYSWSLASGNLPTGLGLSSSGVVSGTPTVQGNFSFTVKVTGGNGLSSTGAFTIGIYSAGTLLGNGSFETGSFSSWVTTDLSDPFVPLTVRTNGYSPGYNLFSCVATDGNYSATCGFDGQGPGTIQIAQDITVSAAAPILFFNYRAGWDMVTYAGSTQARTFSVAIQPSGGGTTLATFTQLTAAAATKNLDTGPLSGVVDLSAYAGTSIRVCFNVYIPEAFTGPGFFELDNVRAVPANGPVITTASPLASGALGIPYSQTLAATGGVAPYSWTLMGGSLPANLNLSSAGVISGTPTSTGTANFTVQAMDSKSQTATKAFSLTTATPQAPTITNSALSTKIAVNKTYSFTYTATGTPTPTFALGGGSFPPGLTISSSGLLSGTPTQIGTYSGTVTASNGVGPTASQPFNIYVGIAPTITDGPPPAGTLGASYSFTYTASGNPVTVTFSLASGSFPPGLSLTSAGVLSGTATQLGTFTGTVSASNGVSPSASQAFSITISNPPPPIIIAPFTTLGSFNGSNGANPMSGVIQASDGNFYGTTYVGGSSSDGAVFKLTPGGTLTALCSFSGSNGQLPFSGVVQGIDGNLYGTTFSGGSSGNGTMFEATPGGMLTSLYSFGASGSGPVAGLIQGSDQNFYGVTSDAGTSTMGTVFKITPTGSLTTLVTFTDTNGAYPEANLIVGSDGNFYGTTLDGGTVNDGTVFKMTSGGSLTTLCSFTGSNGQQPFRGGLLLGSDGNYYGTTREGGSVGDGTVFKMTPGGTLTTLCSFTGTNGSSPYAGVVQGADGNFYGTTYSGGSSGDGTVFMVTPGGSLTTIYTFTGTNGSSPEAGLLLASDGNMYGTTYSGGSLGSGTVFKFTPFFVPATVGSNFNYQITALNTVSTYGVTGTLPNGLSLNPTSGLISGIPTSSGVFSVTLTATNPYGSSSVPFTITVKQAPSITDGPPPSTGSIGSIYSFSYTAGGYPAPSFALGTGTLPPGLTLSGGGLLSGTPTSPGVFSGAVQASNGVNPVATQSFGITILNTFANWENQYFTAQQVQQADPNVVGQNADPEHDGYSNLLKYLFDINPNESMSASDKAALPQVAMATVASTTYLTLTYRENPLAGGITVNFQTSNDLKTWSTVTPDLSQMVGTDSATGDPIVQVGVKSTGGKMQFVRLYVTSP